MGEKALIAELMVVKLKLANIEGAQTLPQDDVCTFYMS